MNNIQVWNFQDSEVRTVEVDGAPYWVLADVCKVLGLSTPSKVAERVDSDDKGMSLIHTPSGNQNMTIINESGLYSVILRSDKPQAKSFKKWITSEVIPSIRQNGGYIANQENMSDAELIAKALTVANRIIENKDRLISEMKPKADYFDTVASSKSAIKMDLVAKNLDFIGVGRNKLFEILRNESILQYNNVPYQEYVDRGYFRVVQSTWTDKHTLEAHTSYTTLVYTKGMNYIEKKLTSLGYKKRMLKTVS